MPATTFTEREKWKTERRGGMGDKKRGRKIIEFESWKGFYRTTEGK